jgi:Carboxypeptidase regulatory-like domain/TonB dependent receptor
MPRSPISRILAILSTCLLLVCLTSRSVAQQGAGSIKGTITDQLGSLVVGATITAKDSKGTERRATTNATGGYELRSLAPGKYELKVSAPGFTVLEEKNVVVRTGTITNLDLQLSIEALEQSVTIDNRKGVSTDSDRNGDALILSGKELEALPDDPEALAAVLQAMAGPPQGENAPQVTVNGFSNGQMPPKEAIREVRINQNPYSAENEYPGWGGIEIFTQPGSEKFHGGAGFIFTDESLNSRNPFAPVRAPYQQRIFNANLTGPIVPKRASFAFYFGRNASDSNAVVNATVLDPVTLNPTLFNQTIIAPNRSTNFGLRGDLKINKMHTLVGNLDYGKGHQSPQGIGGFSLPSRAYRGSRENFTVQLTETAILNEKTINETRLQVQHGIFRQTAILALPALNVQDSFFGGGAQVGTASNTQDRAELQNFTSRSSGRHFFKVGGRLRYVRVRSIAPSNFGGTYNFGGGVGPTLDANNQVIPGAPPIEISSLERYRRTLLFQRQGLSAAEIRILGGGATQLSIAGGNPEADVNQKDIGFYIQDDWKLRPNLTISPGLRYENQSNISSNLNFAPRIGFAWSPTFGTKKTPPPATDTKTGGQATPAPAAPPKTAGPSQPKTVIRGGLGIFYNRISEDLILQSVRFNGINQQQFVVSDTAVLALFPLVPPIGLLNAFAQPQTRRFLAPDLAPLYSFRSSFSLEHQLTRDLKLAINYSHAQSIRTQRTVNINAPLAGTYNPVVPSSGTRPLGNSAGNVLESQSTGRSTYDSLNLGLNGKIWKVNFWSNYSLNKSRGTDTGTSGSSFNPYDFSQEFGRASFDIRHWLWTNFSYQTRSGFSVNGFIVANSGPPFNITTGRDLNGDTFFTERPALATDLNKPGVVVTPLGAFDPNPAPGQPIIPRNFGQAPIFVSVNFGVSKTIKFGRAIQPKNPPPAAAGNVVTTSGNVTTTPPSTTTASQKPPPKPQIQRPYSLSFSLNTNNLLNRNNRGVPVGNMASPYFLKSTGTSGMFFFGPGGGGTGGNRQIILRVRLSF